MSYTLSLNDGAKQTLAALSIEGGVLTRNANAFDSLTLSIDAEFIAAGILAVKDKVTLWDGDTCRFIGEVLKLPRDATATDGPQLSYVVSSYLSRLERTTFTQDVNAVSGDPPALGLLPDAAVVLGRASARPFVRCTASVQIAKVLDFLVSLGAPLSYDSETWPAGFEVPLDQRENIWCWEAVVCMLRWMPDHVLWCDYSSGETVVNLQPSDLLSSASVAADEAMLSTVKLVPRYDLLMSGIRIYFRRTDEFDGRTTEYRSVQTAGADTDPEAQNLYIDLEGGASTSVSQAVEVEAYPSFAAADYGKLDLRLWLQERIPWLKDLADADWTIANIVRGGTHNYESELISGSINKWMPVSSEFEAITFTVEYEIKDAADEYYVERATVKLPVAVTSTNASTKTYRKRDSYQSPETAPAGLAAGIYAAWSVLQWDGGLTSDIDLIGWSCAPGSRINITGGPATWASAAAIVQEASINLADGSISVTCGTCRPLEADSMTALYRAVRGRRYAWKRNLDDVEDAESPAAVEGPEILPQKATGMSPAIARKSTRVADSTGDLTHAVTTAPASITFATPTDATAQDIKLREVLIPCIDGTTGSAIAKLVQVMCGAQYGEAVPLTRADKQSVEIDTDGERHLVGDATSPGAIKYYGTDDSGTPVKGFHSLAYVIDAVIIALSTTMTSPDYVLGRKTVSGVTTYGWVATCTHASQHPTS